MWGMVLCVFEEECGLSVRCNGRKEEPLHLDKWELYWYHPLSGNLWIFISLGAHLSTFLHILERTVSGFGQHFCDTDF